MKVHTIVFDEEQPSSELQVQNIQDNESLFDDDIFYHAQDDGKYYIGVREENLSRLQQRFPSRDIVIFEETDIPWDCGPCY